MSQPDSTTTLQGKGMIRGAAGLAAALWSAGLAGAAPAAPKASGAAPALATPTATAQAAAASNGVAAHAPH
jgi:hypothetical protein